MMPPSRIARMTSLMAVLSLLSAGCVSGLPGDLRFAEPDMLELADQTAELHSVARMLSRGVDTPRRDPHGLAAQEHRGEVEHAVDGNVDRKANVRFDRDVGDAADQVDTAARAAREIIRRDCSPPVAVRHDHD